MSEQGPFASFVPSTDASPEPPKSGKRKGKDKSTKPKVKAAAAEPVKAKKTRKAKAPRAMKVDPLLIFGACVGMTLDSVPVVAEIMETLQKLPKKSRSRVIAALAKIFV